MSTLISFASVRQIEKCNHTEHGLCYRIKRLDGTEEYVNGVVDSIYHDGPHCTTFTVTFVVD
jgi:hypothetical protein